ncbi:MAG: DUF4868 domain-containing protein [Nitrospira sp.]|nr:DUF4868 domain-containing protein [Nitrospira sp.]
MTQSLFAACQINGELVAKRVSLSEEVRQSIVDLFREQEKEFLDGVTEEIPYRGNWKPDKEELLILDVPQEANIFEKTITANATSIQRIKISNFSNEEIKALFMSISTMESTKILVQKFTPHQILGRKFSLIHDGNTFRHLSEPAFTLDTSLTCIIEGGKIKFKSRHNMSSIVSMREIHRVATEPEVRSFTEHKAFKVKDVDAFVNMTNQTSRKLIHEITESGVLDRHTPTQICIAAKETNLTVTIKDGKIVMPTKHNEVKALLQFLNEGRYSGPLSHQSYITNSRRLAEQNQGQ